VIIVSIRTDNGVEPTVYKQLFSSWGKATEYADNIIGQDTPNGQVVYVNVFDPDEINTAEWELAEGVKGGHK
jgi:hypothetical protein